MWGEREREGGRGGGSGGREREGGRQRRREWGAGSEEIIPWSMNVGWEKNMDVGC